MAKAKRIWRGIKGWVYKYIGGLFMDSKDGQLTISLGRTALISVLIQMMWVWRRVVLDGQPGMELPDGMLEVFLALSGYVFGSKAVQVFSNRNNSTVMTNTDRE